MNRVKPWVLLCALLLLAGCAPADPDESSSDVKPRSDSGIPLNFTLDDNWAEVVGDKIVVTVPLMDSAIVIPSFYGATEKDLKYGGSTSLSVQTSCDPDTFGPKVLYEGEWSIQPRFYEDPCSMSPIILPPYPYSLVYSGERTRIFRFNSPAEAVPGVPGDVTYITIVMEGLDIGDTTDT